MVLPTFSWFQTDKSKPPTQNSIFLDLVFRVLWQTPKSLMSFWCQTDVVFWMNRCRFSPMSNRSQIDAVLVRCQNPSPLLLPKWTIRAIGPLQLCSLMVAPKGMEPSLQENDIKMTWKRHGNGMCMTRRWQQNCKNMRWPWPEKDMKMTWKRHGNDMETAWKQHETPWTWNQNGTTIAWQLHGDGMKMTWKGHEIWRWQEDDRTMIGKWDEHDWKRHTNRQKTKWKGHDNDMETTWKWHENDMKMTPKRYENAIKLTAADFKLSL